MPMSWLPKSEVNNKNGSCRSPGLYFLQGCLLPTLPYSNQKAAVFPKPVVGYDNLVQSNYLITDLT